MKTNLQFQGGKERGLLELQKHADNCGYSIPEFLVLDETLNKEELIEIANHFSGSDVIVRSNSLMENNEFGFDGIYKSIVIENCNIEKLQKACKEVHDSLFSPDAITYRKKADITDDAMRVIVQKFMGRKETSMYFVMETSINAQGDISIVMSPVHDFVNVGIDYEEVIIDRNGEIVASTENFGFMMKHGILKKFKTIAKNLQEAFGQPLSIEGAYRKVIVDGDYDDVKIFLFQRRLLPADFYQAQPVVVPSKYKDKDILFRSSVYRGAGKIENLPIILMPGISNVNGWEDDLRKKITQLKSDVILFVPTMHLGKLSSRILNDYSVLSGVRAIISQEEINFLSHAFKVASLARIPFVYVENFSRIETLLTGSLFFTENQAVFCLDEKREGFRFDRLKRSKATSLASLAKKKGVVVELSEEEKELAFHLELRKFSFNDFYDSFHRLLEDVSNEIWLFETYQTHIGFKCENAKGQVLKFSGWAMYPLEGHLHLNNFRKDFENNQIEWSLIQEIVAKLNA